MRVAIYARYSSDNQRDASIDDQFRECRQFAEKEGWKVEEAFSDHALTGDNAFRPGFQALIREARRGRFDIVLGESLDRFSRDQEDTAALFKRLSFASVRFVTLSEGDITPLHIGLKGTMNAMYLKDLADEEISAKDFRTWHATVLTAALLASAEQGLTSVTSRKRVVSTVVKEVAEALGNTPAVCRASYVDPRVIDRFLNGETIALPRGPDLSDDRVRASVESAVLDLLDPNGRQERAA